MMYSSHNKGFTLIELMIALALGLIVVAAGTALFLSAQKSYTSQQAVAQIQDNANFGLNYISKGLRRGTANSGVIFNNNSTGTSSATTGSNVNVKSDQLTIMYTPTDDQFKSGAIFDCEGTQIINGSTVYERYFVRSGGGLACKAARSGDSALAGDGALIIPTVDYFHVLLVTRSSTSNNQYVFQDTSIDRYNGGVVVVGFKLGMIVRSEQPVSGDSFVDDSRTITVLDKDVQLKDDVKNASQRFLREVIIQAVAFRNGVGN